MDTYLVKLDAELRDGNKKTGDMQQNYARLQNALQQQQLIMAEHLGSQRQRADTWYAITGEVWMEKPVVKKPVVDESTEPTAEPAAGAPKREL